MGMQVSLITIASSLTKEELPPPSGVWDLGLDAGEMQGPASSSSGSPIIPPRLSAASPCGATPPNNSAGASPV